jgi:hypothetical protein
MLKVTFAITSGMFICFAQSIVPHRHDSPAEGLSIAALPVNHASSLLNILHSPVSLAQMRLQSSQQQREPAPKERQASLSDTLDWLRNNLPRGIVQTSYRGTYYRTDLGGLGPDTNRSTTSVKVWSLDSCTAIVGDESVGEWERQSGRDTSVTRYTVPLAAIDDGLVKTVDNRKSQSCLGLSSDFAFVGGDTRTFCVTLSSSSKAIRQEFSGKSRDGSEYNLPPSLSYRFYLEFANEALAHRILTAVLHAAELCRTKEPF